MGSTLAAAGMSIQVSACYEIKFSGRYTECSPVSSYKYDRPSHPDWGRLGVLRAAGVDNRLQGLTLAPYQRNPPAKLDS